MQKTTTSIDITFKLYATLGVHLPAGAHRNQIGLTVPEGTTVLAVLEDNNVPLEKCHLVLLNGHFVQPAARAETPLKSGDTLAVWPPIAGG